TLDGSLKMAYQAAGLNSSGQNVPSSFVMTGTASAKFFTIQTFLVSLGGDGTNGLVIVNGQLRSLNLAIDTGMHFSFLDAGVHLTAPYDASNQEFKFGGTAGVSLNTSSLPSWVAGFLPSGTLASIGFSMDVIAGDTHDSYVSVFTTIFNT